MRALKQVSGVALATLTRIEAGNYDPRLSTLRRLAKALRVTVGELASEFQKCSSVFGKKLLQGITVQDVECIGVKEQETVPWLQ